MAIRQIVVSTSTTDSENGSTTFGNTDLTVDITPTFADSRVIIFANAHVQARNVSAGSVAVRYGNWQIYRSSGTPTVIASAGVGRSLSANDTNTAVSYDRLNMIGTEVPGAGTHTYILRYAAQIAGVQAQFKGSSGTQATMLAVEGKP